MFWTLNLAIQLEGAPWPSMKKELSDNCEVYDSIEEIAYNIPSFGDFLNLDDY